MANDETFIFLNKEEMKELNEGKAIQRTRFRNKVIVIQRAE